MEPQDLIRALSRLFAEDAWQKSSLNWRKSTAQTTLTANLQRSNYSSRYFLNFGIYLDASVSSSARAIGGSIRFRAGEIPDVDEAEFSRLLDLENEIDDDARVERIRDIMKAIVFPKLNECDTVDALQVGGAARDLIENVYAFEPEARFLRPDLFGRGGPTTAIKGLN